MILPPRYRERLTGRTTWRRQPVTGCIVLRVEVRREASHHVAAVLPPWVLDAVEWREREAQREAESWRTVEVFVRDADVHDLIGGPA